MKLNDKIYDIAKFNMQLSQNLQLVTSVVPVLDILFCI